MLLYMTMTMMTVAGSGAHIAALLEVDEEGQLLGVSGRAADAGPRAGALRPGRRQLLQPLAEQLLQVLHARARPAIHHEHIQREAVRRVERVRLRDVQAQVPLRHGAAVRP